ncbi:MAG: glycosyltransferase family 2 protein [Frankiaceae bacterium]
MAETTAGGREGPWPPVSVIMCVRNERRHLAASVAAILGQDYPAPLEVVIAVGPSSDRTGDIAAELARADSRVRVVASPTGRTPNGLNLALSATRHGTVARVDGHAMLPPGYLKRAVQVLLETGAGNVGGVMAAEGETPFEQAVARAMTSWLGVGGARFHTGGQAGPVDTVYLGVFPRELLTRLGGYDERFTRAQDYELNVRLRELGATVWFDPELRVTYRPRPTVRALADQYFNYGRWRWMVTRQHPRSVRGRYLAPPAALLACIAGAVVAAVGHPVGLVVPAAYVAGVAAGSIGIGRDLPGPALVRLAPVLVTMHMSWAAGFLSSALRGMSLPPARPPQPASGASGAPDQSSVASS